MHAIPRHVVSQDWITAIFLCVLLVLMLVKMLYPEEFYNFRRLLTSQKYFSENQKSTRIFGGFSYALFFLNALLITLGLSFFIVNVEGIPHEVSFVLFLKVFLVYTVFIVGKYLVERILGVLFSIEGVLDQYVFFKTTYKNFLALCIFPLLLVITYLWAGSPFFFSVVVVLFLFLNLVFLGRYYKKQRNFISSNLLYFILYLCTFEIAPYYILYKAIA